MTNRMDSFIYISAEKSTENKPEGILEELNSFILHLDIIMIRILQKFYKSGLSFPSDTSCYYVQQLQTELKREGLKIELETLRKRLDTLVKIRLLEKVGTYPRIYMPIRDVEKVQRIVEKVQKILI